MKTNLDYLRQYWNSLLQKCVDEQRIQSYDMIISEGDFGVINVEISVLPKKSIEYMVVDWHITKSGIEFKYVATEIPDE